LVAGYSYRRLAAEMRRCLLGGRPEKSSGGHRTRATKQRQQYPPPRGARVRMWRGRCRGAWGRSLQIGAAGQLYAARGNDHPALTSERCCLVSTWAEQLYCSQSFRRDNSGMLHRIFRSGFPCGSRRPPRPDRAVAEWPKIDPSRQRVVRRSCCRTTLSQSGRTLPVRSACVSAEKMILSYRLPPAPRQSQAAIGTGQSGVVGGANHQRGIIDLVARGLTMCKKIGRPCIGGFETGGGAPHLGGANRFMRVGRHQTRAKVARWARQHAKRCGPEGMFQIGQERSRVGTTDVVFSER